MNDYDFGVIAKILSVLCFCMILSFGSLAQAPYQFERFTINEGLSNNSVRRILQDEKGFLWFGTLNGLNRFDGTNFRAYKAEPGNVNSLSNNRIHLLMEDTLQYIWVVTFNNEVHRFDPRTENFLNIDRLIREKKLNYIPRPKSIVEGSPGVVWILPENGGVIRFKGSSIPGEYTIDIFDVSNLLPSNNVRFVHRDKTGSTWIGTERGLVKLKTDTFAITPDFHTYYDQVQPVSFGEICETPTAIWLGTKKDGIFRYSFKGDTIRPWNNAPGIHSEITSMSLGIDNSLIATTRGSGVLHIQSGGKRFRHYTASQRKTAGDIEDLFTDSYADKNGLFWLVSAYRRGVTLFDPQTEKFIYYDLNAKFREPLGDSEKHVFFEDSNGFLWLGLYGGGLCRFDNERRVFDQYFYSQKNPGSISSNLVLTIYEDRSKNLWIGTFHGGLNKVSLFKNNFSNTEPNPDTRFRLNNEVRSSMEDRFERLWIGTKGGKVKCYDRDNNCLFTLPDDLPVSSRFHMHSVYSLLGDRQGNLWIGTKGDGLFRIEGILKHESIKNKAFQISNFKRDSEDPSSLSLNTVYALLEDDYGQIWVGTYNGGLDLIRNPSADKVTFEHFTKGFSSNNALSDNRIRSLMLDNDGNLWIGTSNGLNLLEARYMKTEDKRFIRFVCDPSSSTSLSNNDIICLHQDSKNNIWAGTYGGGLNKLVKGSDRNVSFVSYTQNDGLPSDVIYSIEEDDSGSFWLGTDNGLCKFAPFNGRVENYLKEDGLGGNIFSEATSIASSNGELIFGNLNGFVRFSPEMIRKDKQHYPIVFTNFKVFNERVRPGDQSVLGSTIETVREITLDHDQNFVSIEFSVLDFKAPEKTQYSYILENFEDQWNYVVGENQAVYRALSPGEYVFKVKGTNSDGVWMGEPKTLKMVIQPPIWKTSWAYAAYAIMILLGIGFVLYFVRHEIRLQNEVVLEKRLTENKLRFYTNISHEFKTPLTLILGPVEDLLGDPNLPLLLKNKMEIVKRNSKRLLHLVEQLLDFRKIQSDKMELKTQSVELFGFFKDFYISFLPIAEKKQIRFHFTPNFRKLNGWIDPEHVEKIVMNLLSNAFKHASSGKNIYFEPHVDQEGKVLSISVKDQGKGINHENVAKIFEQFTASGSIFVMKNECSGLGLPLSRDLAHLHKGQIIVKNMYPHGSAFIVTLPIGEEAYTDEEKNTSPGPSFHRHLRGDMIVLYPKKTEAMPSASATKNRLLLIEDNDELRDYLSDKLKRYFSVATASDGTEGLQKAIRFMPDLIVCDIMMPGISGLVVTERLKQNRDTSHIPVILLTARSSADHKTEGIETGADDYITKPFHFEYLNLRIQKIIEQRKKLREKFSNEPTMKVSELGGTSADQKFLAKVIHLVEEKMGESEFNVDLLIKEMSCSRTFFYKKIKRISGYSPNEFVRTVRMKKAALMLKSGDFTVAEVSYNVGINDPNYFSKCFKNHFGESPSDYYRKNKAMV